MIYILVWFVTIAAYGVGLWLNNKFKISLFNPFLVASLLIISVMIAFGLPYAPYGGAGQSITYFLGPVVVMLAIPLYKSRKTLTTHFIPIAAGIFVGIISSAVSVIGLACLFKLEPTVLISLMPKSITNPMAIEVTKMFEGISAVTVTAVVVTGVFGASVAPAVFRMGRITQDTAKGIALGAASHGVGTARAIEISQEAGAASGLSMGITGVATVLLAGLIRTFLN